jgi:ABC-type branched-subunit amino acid transport system substrate-binding protein
MVDYPMRDYQLEGFIFNAIFADIRKDQDSVVWALFYNESFDKILREAYQRQKGYLPFTIAE